MNGEVILGLIILAGAVSFLSVIIWWSRRAIDKIAETENASARAIHVSGSTRILKRKPE